MEQNSFKIDSSKINTFEKFQKDMLYFASNYIDNYQKEKFFSLNVSKFLNQKSFYSKMLTCFKNIRQLSEKIDECIKKEEKNKNNMLKEINSCFKINLVIM